MRQQNKSSFRDPSGFIFKEDNKLLRQINLSYQADYDHLMKSGLYQELTKQNLIIAHTETDYPIKDSKGYKIISPQFIPFISYPYEWCFGQLKTAALVTLKIQKIALQFGMSLKDASAFNIQFYKGKPVLIDTLSFELYKKEQPWIAYKQFCQHFLAPLSLMVYKDFRLNQLPRLFIDGIPLDLASQLLPWKSKLKFSLLTHIHLHARSQKHFANKQIDKKRKSFSKNNLLALIDSLESTTKKLSPSNLQTEWEKYYTFTNYSDTAFNDKKKSINKWIEKIKPQSVWDLGGNTGLFSRLASKQNINTISFDIDLLAVEKNYKDQIKNKEKHILPLFCDLTNPSPDLGWAHQERDSLQKRGPADIIMALALIHHLAISNNLPFYNIAEYFSKLGNWLIIEFVPKDDSKVQKLLSTRQDIFTKYNEDDFEKSFSDFFDIQEKTSIVESKRTMYLMKNKKSL
jgi:hypothetical protein